MIEISENKAQELITKLSILREEALDQVSDINSVNELIAHTMNSLETLFVVLNAAVENKPSTDVGEFIPIGKTFK